MKHFITNLFVNIKFTREDKKDNKLTFFDCTVHIEVKGNLNTEVYKKLTHTDQCLPFDSHHPLKHKWLSSELYITGRRVHLLWLRENKRNIRTPRKLFKPVDVLVHPEDKTPKHKRSGVVYAMQ